MIIIIDINTVNATCTISFCTFWQNFYVPFDSFLRSFEIFKKFLDFFLFRNATEENEEEIARRHHLLKGTPIYCLTSCFSASYL